MHRQLPGMRLFFGMDRRSSEMANGACVVSWFAAAIVTLGAARLPADTVLHDVRVIDGLGGAPIEHADLLITGERIASITAMSPSKAYPGATVIDLHGKTALPGLISNHSHLGMVNGTQAGGRNVTPDNILRQLRQYEAYGVTTVTSLGLNLQSFYDLQPRLHVGSLPGADMFGADRGVGAASGAPPSGMGILDDQVYRPTSVDAARRQVRETAARHPSFIKIWVDDFHETLPAKMDPVIYQAIIEEAHAQGIRVAAHVFYLADAKRLVESGVDVLAHGVRDQVVDAEFIRSMKVRHVWYIPTLGLDEASYLFAEHPEMTTQPVLHQALQPALAVQFADAAWRDKVLGDAVKLKQNHEAFTMNLRNLTTLYNAGVSIGFGTDSGAAPLRIAGFAEHRELLLMTQAGLTPLQAIGVATRNAAELLLLDDRGTLQPGKLADLLVVDGNPAETIEDVDRIVSVWHRGKPVGGSLAAFSP
jgi:imidazolonepropionase-like amidohydrolase